VKVPDHGTVVVMVDIGTSTVTTLVVYTTDPDVTVSGPVTVLVNEPVHGTVIVESPAVGVSITTTCSV